MSAIRLQLRMEKHNVNLNFGDAASIGGNSNRENILQPRPAHSIHHCDGIARRSCSPARVCTQRAPQPVSYIRQVPVLMLCWRRGWGTRS